MDTGATSHLTTDSGYLSSVLNKSIVRSVLVGNGNCIPVVASGTKTTALPNRNLYLKNAFVTPGIIKNLIFVRQFTIDNNFSVEFDPSGFSVKDLNSGTLVMRCNSSGELYPLTISAQSPRPVSHPLSLAVVSTDIWYSRLGHPSAAIIDSLRSQSLINCNKEATSKLCHSCQISKHVQLPFYPSGSNTI
ncbi:unnamed protein product, partial [Cuscuta europaea]